MVTKAAPTAIIRKKQACVYCNAIHKRCVQSDGIGKPCDRCKKQGRFCLYRQHRRRGPKGKKMKVLKVVEQHHSKYQKDANFMHENEKNFTNPPKPVNKTAEFLSSIVEIAIIESLKEYKGPVFVQTKRISYSFP